VLLHDALANNKDMNITISGVAQTSFSTAFALTSTSKVTYVSRWVSDFLNVTSISANTWVLNFAAKSGDALATYPSDGSGKVFANIYIWRPSTNAKVGTIVDGACSNTTSNDGETAEKVVNVNFTGAAVTCQVNDVIIVEIWLKPNTVFAASYTCVFYYDGTTAGTTDDATVSNHASFLQTPQDNLFTPPSITATSDTKDIRKPIQIVKV
jgi:hypothetical protein